MLEAELAVPGEVRKKRAYHHGDLRNSIIGAVAALIGEQRSPNIQLRDVAERVGTSQPAIYKHFESKQHLLVEVAIAGYDLQKQFRDRALALARPSPLHGLLAIGIAYIRFSQLYPGYFLLMKTFETAEILSSPRYQAQREETLEVFGGLVEACFEQGLFRPVGFELAMATLQTAAFGLAHLYIGGQMEFVAPTIHDDPELAGQVYCLSFAGLMTPAGHRLLEEQGTNPFLAVPPIPDVLDPGD
jgi:AcrR family transcriptional regulator